MAFTKDYGDSMSQPQAYPRRIPSLDGLRGLSIWAVLLAHISAHFSNTPFHNLYTHMVLSVLAYFGVTIFFVISGFLITYLLLKERSRSSTISLARFYRRRAVRILPAFLIYTGIILMLGRASLPQEVYAFTFTTSYFFEQAYRPLQQLWSLSVEEQFYLVWPLLMLCGTWTAQRCCWVVMILCPILRLGLKHAGYREYSHLAPAIADSIAAGCLLALHYEQIRSFARRHLISNRAFISLSLCTVLFAAGVYRLDLVLLWGLVPCLVTLVISAAIERQDRVLNSGPLVWSGLMSYSLYMWQQPFLVFDGPLNYLSVRLPLTFLAGYLSYRFVEQPVLRLFSPASSRSEVRAPNPVAQES